MIRRRGKTGEGEAEAYRFIRASDAGRPKSDGLDEFETAWSALKGAGGDPDLLRMRAQALRSAAGVDRRRLMLGALGSGAAVAAGGGGLLAAGAAGAVVSTREGQRLETTLPDGSRVTLAPLTRLRVTYGPTRRTVRLEKGQAAFDALFDDDKPFVVTAAGQTATCLGGRFQVTLDGEAAAILAETTPLLVRASGGGAVQRVMGGQVLAAASGRVQAADVDSLISWRSGRLVFDDEPLSEVASAFNRYSSDRLEVADAADQIRVSGSFRYDGAQDFTRALETAFNLRVRQVDKSTWRIEPNTSAGHEG